MTPEVHPKPSIRCPSVLLLSPSRVRHLWGEHGGRLRGVGTLLSGHWTPKLRGDTRFRRGKGQEQ